MRGEAGELAVSNSDIGALSPEKQQEQELMGKLAATGKLPARPASSFLQKKLQQRKFFDSGDYAMDKSKAGTGLGSKPHPLAGGHQQPPMAAVITTPASQPTPPAATSATTPSPSASPISQQTSRPSAERGGGVEDDNLQIPRPDTVPQRKASIINPSVHCKLSPAPHVQHHDVASPTSTNE